MRAVLFLLVGSLFFAGCSSSVSRMPLASSQPSQEFTRMEQPAGKLTVEYSAEGKKAASDNLTFNMDELTSTIRRALEAGDMLKVSNESSQPTIEVVITDVYARSTVNAFLWGFMAGADSIEGDVTVRSSRARNCISSKSRHHTRFWFRRVSMGWLLMKTERYFERVERW